LIPLDRIIRYRIVLLHVRKIEVQHHWRRTLQRSLGKKFIEGDISPQKARALLNKYLGKGTKPPEKDSEVQLDKDHWLLRDEDGRYSVEIR